MKQELKIDNLKYIHNSFNFQYIQFVNTQAVTALYKGRSIHSVPSHHYNSDVKENSAHYQWLLRHRVVDSTFQHQTLK